MAERVRSNPILARITRVTEYREFMIVYIIVLGTIAIAYAVPAFMSRQNTSAILLALADQSIIAIGMTLLLVSGGFDMSVGTMMALAGVTTAIWQFAIGGMWSFVRGVLGVETYTFFL